MTMMNKRCDLTWQDIRDIVHIAGSVIDVTEDNDVTTMRDLFPDEESYYGAVLEEWKNLVEE